MNKDYKEENFCNFLVHWVQTDPICWFNALLIATLFSQRSRKIITQIIHERWVYKRVFTIENNVKKFLNTFVPRNLNYIPNDYKIYDVIFRIIKYLLHRRNLKNIQYDNDTAFFNNYSSKRILMLLNKFNSSIFPINVADGSLSIFYIKQFYKLLGINCLILNKLPNNNIVYSIFNDATIVSNNKYNPNIKNKMYIANELKKEHDIIIVECSSLFNNIPNHYYINNYNPEIIPQVNAMNNIIKYNNSEYELDSIILHNWNHHTINIGHAIAGITCNKQRYVYNGWYSKTNDPAMRKKIGGLNETHCPLMRYDWNPKVNYEFHLNPIKCTLDKYTNIKDIAFSFARGDKLLIYIKKPSQAQLDKQYELEKKLIERENSKAKLNDNNSAKLIYQTAGKNKVKKNNKNRKVNKVNKVNKVKILHP